jgi:hypothetical protein
MSHSLIFQGRMAAEAEEKRVELLAGDEQRGWTAGARTRPRTPGSRSAAQHPCVESEAGASRREASARFHLHIAKYRTLRT